MKKATLILFASLVLFLSACSFETYAANPAYSGRNSVTKHGQKDQVRYAKRNIRKHGVISSIL